jgi:hypothetical protein
VLLLVAAAVALVGLALVFLPSGWLSRIGRLPGDIYISRPGFTFVFPITTMVIISIVLTVVFWLGSLLLRR